ncbi:GNAT family N-acetyltransferase [Streptomyces sp. NPDC002574]|uniref:GNAT family N-acetyltransferase n=1 Tax=Streptomyces sp. NPDC002574 TaxID=3364652 RepID=UPI0036C0BD0A
MFELIAPTTRLHAAWLEAHEEWGPGQHEDGFGLGPSDDVDSPDGFADWVAMLAAQSGPEARETGRGCTYRWIVERDLVHGGIAFRHGPNDFVLQYGHIGYGIRPSSRRRGLATWALTRMLDEARALGLDQVLLVCEAANIASARTIEHSGGTFDALGDTEHGAVRRYSIKL